MKIIKKSKEINLIIKNFKNTGFVPTMGSLHKGHESLIKKSKTQNKFTFVSIFLNPKQFNNKKDLKKYPKKIKNDIKICKNLKVDYLFLPSFKEVFTWKTKNKKYPKINNLMEQKFRRGHFRGVLQVIEKLLDILPARKIYLGEKDYQQLVIIKNYINLNKINCKVVKCKTFRDKNGLALSSRNKLLSTQALDKASKVIKFIRYLKKKKHNLDIIIKSTKKYLKDNEIKYDYIENINLDKFKIQNKITNKTRIFIAFYIKNIRLIDNF